MDRITKRAVGALTTWAKRHHVPFHTPIFLGVSGGADSLALMIAAAKSRFSDITVVTVDHGIQHNSRAQALQVCAQAQELGLPCIIETVPVPADEDAGNMEAIAREGRYKLFEKYPLVMLAHTMNDQAETMVLGLGRGSGARSCQGMQEFRDNKYARPFLELTRQDTEAICRAHGILYWDDPHNEHEEYRRVHVRRRVIPALTEVFGDGILKNFSRTAKLLQEDSEALDLWAEQAVPSDATDMWMPQLDHLPAAIRKRVLKNWLESWGEGQEALKMIVLERIDGLSTGGLVPLNANVQVKKERGGWRILL